MKNKLLVLGMTLCLIGASASYANYEPVGESQQKPLMVIRFNQPTVVYEKALYDTMTKVFQVKPSAKLEVISVATKASDKEGQKHYNDVASANTDKVIATFQQMHLPQSRYTVTTIAEPVKYSEVRIFVH